MGILTASWQLLFFIEATIRVRVQCPGFSNNPAWFLPRRYTGTGCCCKARPNCDHKRVRSHPLCFLGALIDLGSPERLFKEKVIGSEAAKEKLQRWLSLAKTDYILHTMGFRTPKIWLLTGFIELEDTISSASTASNNSVEFGFSQELIAALTATPIGASVKANTGMATTGILETFGKNIWAAQFQRLDARYIKLDPRKPPSPLTIQLMFRPTYPLDAVLSGDDDDAVNVGVHDPELLDKDADISDEEYWQEMTEAEERWDEED